LKSQKMQICNTFGYSSLPRRDLNHHTNLPIDEIHRQHCLTW
jgi:hypothetical protein